MPSCSNCHLVPEEEGHKHKVELQQGEFGKRVTVSSGTMGDPGINEVMHLRKTKVHL